MALGFIGLGIMGQPMALNLVRAGNTLVAWNRTPAAAEPLRRAGAVIVDTPAEVFRQSEVVSGSRRPGEDGQLVTMIAGAPGDVIESSPMASGVTAVKAPKLIAGDFAAQAATTDAYRSNQLIAAARSANIATPVLDECHRLFAETVALGHGALDLQIVLRAIEERTKALESETAK